MYGNSNLPFTMNVTPSGNSNGNGSFWGGDAWILIILFALIFGWGNNGYGGYGGVSENYTLVSDMGQIERKIDGVYSGICDSTFSLNNTITNGFASAQSTMTQGFAGLNTALIQQGYEGRIATQGVGNTVQNCCCDLKQQIGDVKYTIGSTGAEISRGVERGFADTNYNLATQANMLDRTVSDKFCQTNFNMQTNTRDIVDSQNAGTRAILDKLCQMEASAKDDKIAELTAKLNRADLAASQAAQNNYLINELKPCPKAAYIVPNPYCNCQCGQTFGTTIA